MHMHMRICMPFCVRMQLPLPDELAALCTTALYSEKQVPK